MHVLRVAIVIVSLLSVQGCAAVALTTAGLAVGVGVKYTLNSNAYKTFTSPVADLRMATLKTLNRMGMKVTQDHETASGWKIVATAKDRKIDIELESLTPKTTRMRVVANKGEIFFKDRATATEIIVQTWEAIPVPAVGSLARTELIITTGSGEQVVARTRASRRQVGSSANGLLTNESQINPGNPAWKKKSSKMVRGIQSDLAMLGYDPGPVDGKMGPNTYDAIIRYQKDHRLLDDGKPSPKLAQHIRQQAQKTGSQVTRET